MGQPAVCSQDCLGLGIRLPPENSKDSPKGEYVNCLGGCNKKFLSRDRRTNRICPACTRKLRDVSEPRVAKFGTIGGKGVSFQSEE